MKFVQLVNLKLLTTANSFLLNIAERENFSANKYEIANNKISLLINLYENANYYWHFHIYEQRKFHAQLS